MPDKDQQEKRDPLADEGQRPISHAGGDRKTIEEDIERKQPSLQGDRWIARSIVSAYL